MFAGTTLSVRPLSAHMVQFLALRTRDGKAQRATDNFPCSISMHQSSLDPNHFHSITSPKLTHIQ